MTTQKFDVIICGSGSAGLCAAVWLARYGISCKILEKRPGPLAVGQADGVQCRTVEIFESLGLAEELLRESYHVLEVSFWGSNGNGGIARTSRTFDTEPGLSHMPHVILNQARVNGLLIEAMERLGGQKVDYGYDVESVQVDSTIIEDQNAYPVTIMARKGVGKDIYKAKYALVCVYLSTDDAQN